MTIICIKDRKLAWDSQLTASGGLRWGSVRDKVRAFKKAGHVFYLGGCGQWFHIQAFIRRIEDMDEEVLREFCKDPKHNVPNSTSLFMYDPLKQILFEFGDKGPPVWLDMKGKNYALGTGYEYAYGVMDSGKSAREAVKMVVGRFDGCGLPIRTAEWRKK